MTNFFDFYNSFLDNFKKSHKERKIEKIIEHEINCYEKWADRNHHSSKKYMSPKIKKINQHIFKSNNGLDGPLYFS